MIDGNRSIIFQFFFVRRCKENKELLNSFWGYYLILSSRSPNVCYFFQYFVSIVVLHATLIAEKTFKLSTGCQMEVKVLQWWKRAYDEELKCYACLISSFYRFKRQPHRTIKHIQAICRVLLKNCLSVFDHFVWLILKGLNFCNASNGH